MLILKKHCRVFPMISRASYWRYLSEADITCLDYSPDMMGQAQKRPTVCT